MKMVKFYVESLKRILEKKNYAINRMDLDSGFFSAIESLYKEIESVQSELNCPIENKVNVRFALLNSEAVLPSYAKPGDAGLDLTAITAAKVIEGYFEYDFGLAVEIPEGYVGLIFPRSSITKTDLTLSNCVGVIDSGYRGPLTARFRKTNEKNPRTYQAGDRVAQLVVLPFPQVTVEKCDYESLTKTERGTGGFGSSGK